MLQLIHPLLPNPLHPPPTELQISSLRVLEILIDECAPCMLRWKFMILDGVGRCWVTLKDAGSITGEARFFALKTTTNAIYPYLANSELRMLLQNTCASLAKSCPSVVEVSYLAFVGSFSCFFHVLCLRTTRSSLPLIQKCLTTCWTVWRYLPVFRPHNPDVQGQNDIISLPCNAL